MQQQHEIKSVTFFGCSCGRSGERNFDDAREAARLVALSGRRIINGGGPGVMLAATLGAKEGGGKCTAVYYKPKHASKFEGKAAENFADRHYAEKNYILRTKKLLELGDAYIVFNGGTGTISEFSMAWGLARLYFGHHKPLILYGTYWHDIMSSFKKNMLIREDELKVFTIVSSPEEAIKAIEKYDRLIQTHNHQHQNCITDECRLFI